MIAIIAPLPFIEATGNVALVTCRVVFFLQLGPGLLLLQISESPSRFCPAILSG